MPIPIFNAMKIAHIDDLSLILNNNDSESQTMNAL
jgi:hypothetical protein